MTPDKPVPLVPPLARTGPALQPMLLPQPILLPVLDTNALLTEACYLVKHRRQDDKITALAGTGRANPFVAQHVLEEIDEHLPKLAAHYGVAEAEVRALLEQQILPATRVVDLEIRDHLGPQTRHIMRVDRPGPEAVHVADPDDAPTMALAEFLSPCVIVSQDGVFSRFGFAVIDTIPVVQKLLRMAGLESSTSDALVLIDAGLRLLGIGAKAVVDLARRHPFAAGLFLFGVLWFARRRGYLTRDALRRGADAVWELAGPAIERSGASMEEQKSLRDALLVVEPGPFPSVEQTAARYLARCGKELTPAQLRDRLVARGHKTSAAELKRTMNAHRAFTRLSGDRYTVGRPAHLQRHT